MGILTGVKIPPMLAVRELEPFDDEDFIFEVKWDGYRCIAFLEGETRLQSRNLLDLTPRFPELDRLYCYNKGSSLVLDGEIILLENGVPSFQQLLARDRLRDPFRIRQASRQHPVIYVAFDILYFQGESLMDLPLLERKERLAKAVTQGDNLIISQYVAGEGKAFFQACIARDLEGVMAKKVDSRYLPGKRTKAWRKIKKAITEDLVICGYTPGKGARENFGALILGAYQGRKLIFQGQVGTGFTAKELARLLRLLQELETEHNPFGAPVRGVTRPHWVRPELVCQVEYLEKTRDGIIRHGSYKGLRMDKDPLECRVEGKGD